ncbi:hypothetical protein ACQFN5_29555 (plasmid) [Klebsiella sp. WOUb02]|uniref:hypothetical protein n=1 Tax=Klebsiella sp. WOUb02 TaxID=3161071 RepID=UPI003CEAAE5B
MNEYSTNDNVLTVVYGNEFGPFFTAQVSILDYADESAAKEAALVLAKQYELDYKNKTIKDS